VVVKDGLQQVMVAGSGDEKVCLHLCSASLSSPTLSLFFSSAFLFYFFLGTSIIFSFFILSVCGGMSKMDCSKSWRPAPKMKR
jgi:hypothetical protein